MEETQMSSRETGLGDGIGTGVGVASGSSAGDDVTDGDPSGSDPDGAVEFHVVRDALHAAMPATRTTAMAPNATLRRGR